MSEKGVVQLLLLLVVLAAVAFAALLFVTKGSLQKKTREALRPFGKVDLPLSTQYKNPLDKNSQYINPFSQYKNPFDTLK